MLPVVVIGSGPAGVAALRALLDAGVRVTVLDAGDRIETGGMEVFDALAKSEPEDWSPELAGRVRGAFPVGIKRVPVKPAYGSLFPYALDDLDFPVERENAETSPSLAFGGLSNAWGASVLPVRQRDIEAWPITLQELSPHYEAVLRFMPLAAERDELAEILPLYTDSPGSLRRGPQVRRLLSHMRGHARALTAAGFSFGASRLAVRTAGDPHGCRYGGLCLHGCPYRSIYASSQTLSSLLESDPVDYRGGLYVDRLTESGDSVTIDFHDRGNPTRTGRLLASRVIVAGGAISTTRLVFESLGATSFRRRLKDSQYFVVPMLTPRAVPVSTATQGNTLAQVFVELDDFRISPHSIHLQVYGYNDLMVSALAARVPLSAGALERALAPLLGRLLVLQGYLHSSESPGLTVERSRGSVRLVGEQPTAGVASVRKVLRRLTMSGRLLGMVPLPGLAQVGHPGKSNHLGGAFPMRAEPGALETDILGRLPRWERIHLVDASVFPSMPATTVTLSVMANAHRIAAAAAELGR